MQTPTVLVVDDEALIRYALTERLTAAGYHVLEADTAAGALAKCEEGVDLVLLDYRLPDGDGLAVLKRIKERDPTSTRASGLSPPPCAIIPTRSVGSLTTTENRRVFGNLRWHNGCPPSRQRAPIVCISEEPSMIENERVQTGGPNLGRPVSLDGRLRELEVSLISWALTATRGNKSNAAELLQIGRSTLGDRIDRCGLALTRRDFNVAAAASETAASGTAGSEATVPEESRPGI